MNIIETLNKYIREFEAQKALDQADLNDYVKMARKNEPMIPYLNGRMDMMDYVLLALYGLLNDLKKEKENG